MSLKEIAKIIEGVLFVSGDGVEIEEFKSRFEMNDREFNKCLDILKEKYNKDNESSEEDATETNSFSNDSIKNEYDENNNRTSINAEKQVSSGSTIDKGNKSDFEKVDSVEKGNSSETAMSLDKYNSTESYVLHVVGKQAGNSYSKLLKEFRDTFLNIDLDVINSLSDLFLNLW
mgnify:CR=1 FL=1